MSPGPIPTKVTSRFEGADSTGHDLFFNLEVACFALKQEKTIDGDRDLEMK
jgi:hypothetical protein